MKQIIIFFIGINQCSYSQYIYIYVDLHVNKSHQIHRICRGRK
jgi:hypothetical protein